MGQILVFFHCPSNTGYAIDTYERRFFAMAVALVGDPSKVHFAFTDLEGGQSGTLPGDFSNFLEFDPRSTGDRSDSVARYIREHGITLAFGVDQPVSRPAYRVMRSAGVRHLISYWGAPMSSVVSPPRLWLNRLRVRASRSGPDHYVFESKAMARTATHGSGIPPRRTSVVYLGVDVAKYAPEIAGRGYLSQALGIPEGRSVVVYAGHMEERKGVRVIIEAAKRLVEGQGREDLHFLIVGNRPGEEQPFVDMLGESPAARHVTFGGYRSDLSEVFSSCDLGVIPSTGWDSLTVSAIEMAASGLPLLVSDLGGLPETVDPGVTGLVFPPGDSATLAKLIERLITDPVERSRMARHARERVVRDFSTECQVDGLVRVCRGVISE